MKPATSPAVQVCLITSKYIALRIGISAILPVVKRLGDLNLWLNIAFALGRQAILQQVAAVRLAITWLSKWNMGVTLGAIQNANLNKSLLVIAAGFNKSKLYGNQFNKMLQNGELILVIHSTAFMHKGMVLEAGGYDPTFISCEDLEFFNRLSDHGPVLAIPEAFILYRIHGSSNTMKHFPLQRIHTRFIIARQKAKARGRQQLTLDDFLRTYKSRPLLERSQQKILDLSHFYYRLFGVMISGRNYPKAILYFLMSAMLKPSYALPRAWHQRFGKTARETIRLAREHSNTR